MQRCQDAIWRSHFIQQNFLTLQTSQTQARPLLVWLLPSRGKGGNSSYKKDYDANTASKCHPDRQQGKDRMWSGLQPDTEWICMSIRWSGKASAHSFGGRAVQVWQNQGQYHGQEWVWLVRHWCRLAWRTTVSPRPTGCRPATKPLPMFLHIYCYSKDRPWDLISCSILSLSPCAVWRNTLNRGGGIRRCITQGTCLVIVRTCC